MNNFYVTINGVNYTNRVFPFKYGEFLDEQLDYATLTLSRISTESFVPSTPVQININDGFTSVVKHYRISLDSATETPHGQGTYRHELTLIEPTKYLEGFMVESLCVTNANGRAYKQETPLVEFEVWNDRAPKPLPSNYVTPLQIGTSLSLINVKDLIDYPYEYNVVPSGPSEEQRSQINITYSNGEMKTIYIPAMGIVSDNSFIIEQGIQSIRYHFWISGEGVQQGENDIKFSIWGTPNYYPLKPWTIKEVINRALELTEPLVWDKNKVNEKTVDQEVTVTPHGVPGGYPTFSKTVGYTQGTITAAIITNIPELIRYGVLADIKFTDNTYTVSGTIRSANILPEYLIKVQLTTEYVQPGYVTPPRFEFRYKDAADPVEIALFDQLSPEFTFTRATLREVLQEIGGYIHAQPRLDENNKVYFDRYGEQDIATYYDYNKNKTLELNQYHYNSKTITYGIEQACTRVDSYVDNLVNQISAINATVGQPHENGYQSLRTDSSYIRFEEGNMIFPTVYPVSQISKLYWVDTSGSAVTKTKYDITKYVFEKAIYDSQLSSYTEVYPASKAYGLYYTQGQKNLGGFFFKVPDITGGVLSEYSIVNIIRAVTGDSDWETSDYTKLSFELEYIPVYSARVGHSKQYIGDWLNYPRTIAQNQSANMVETQYYGENIKGLVQRLGNLEKTYTFEMMHQDNLPKVGQLWDDDYYISTMAVEVNSDRFRCTVGLSKNFNRISQYIGANSYKRIFQVSERMVQERQSIYTDYLIITEKTTALPGFKANCLLHSQPAFWGNLRAMFMQEATPRNPRPGKVSSVIIQGETKNGKETLSEVILPVISSAFGNVMEFSWEFRDNFSAGMRAVEASIGNVSGTFGQEVQYCDYYGRMYYENFRLCVTLNDSTSYNNEMNYPLLDSFSTDIQNYYVTGTFLNAPIVKRKDSREALKENYGVEFLTDVKNMIIGSAFAANNPLVSGLNPKAKAVFVILRSRINKFSRKVNLSTLNIAAQYDIDGMNINSKNQDSQFYLEGDGVTATANGNAWAFITPVYNGEPYTVEDEDGNVSTITPTYGGELLFGRNVTVTTGDVVGAFRIIGTHDVFEYLESKEA